MYLTLERQTLTIGSPKGSPEHGFNVQEGTSNSGSGCATIRQGPVECPGHVVSSGDSVRETPNTAVCEPTVEMFGQHAGRHNPQLNRDIRPRR